VTSAAFTREGGGSASILSAHRCGESRHVTPFILTATDGPGSRPCASRSPRRSPTSALLWSASSSRLLVRGDEAFSRQDPY